MECWRNPRRAGTEEIHLPGLAPPRILFSGQQGLIQRSHQ